MNQDIIAIGGSAGSLSTVLSIAAGLPADFTGNVFVVVHIGHSRSRLPDLITRAGKLPATAPGDREPIKPGRIYIAPTDRHLLVEPGLVRVSRGPREHFTRPAIDPLFRSAARVYGARVIGVVLSGRGSDGAAGLDAIKRAGGLAVVLDPREAVAAEMPTAVAEIADPDFVAAEAELPALLARLSREAILAVERQPSGQLPEPIQMPESPLALTCPECGGTVRKIGNGTAAQFRCHIGHIFGAQELIPAQLELLEKALDVVQRVLNERIELSRQMAEDVRTAGRTYGVQYWERVRAEAQQQVDAIRRVLPDPANAELEPQDASN
jgi:two-component system, chemotaxis family, protein-glutamate methylesterase/glutaminase